MALAGPTLSKAQERNVEAICAIGPSGLARVEDRLRSEPLMVDRNAIERLIVEEVGDDNGVELARFLFGIAIGFRQDSSAPDAALAQVSDRVDRSADATTRFASWSECRPILGLLLGSKSIRASTKAMEVSYDFERVYQAARFLTSIRPIFNDTRDEIIGATVVQTLRLEFISSAGELASLSIALDQADIEQLRRSCEEAIRKAEVAYQFASDDSKLPTLRPGDA